MRMIALLTAAALSLAASASLKAQSYRLAETLPLGTPDRWDYVVYDDGTKRVYIAHGDRLEVVDAATGKLVGTVNGIPGGTHGVAISVGTGQGFTDDGKAGTAVAFDLKTLDVTKAIKADVDADAITADKATGHVFVIEGDPAAVTVIDPKSDTVVATIKVGEKLEYGVGDDAGTIYVAGEELGDLVRINARTNKVISHFPLPGCTSPHGLAIDRARRRLFVGCVNSVMFSVDMADGHVVATLPIGRGSDAVAYDPVRQRVFSSNGADGTITVYQQTTADRYTPLEPIKTAVSGRTMSVDPTTGRIFVVAADTDPSPTPGGRARTRPDTLKLLMFDPAP